MARTVRILIADIRANASNRVGVDIITGRTKVPSSVGEDGAGDGAGNESRTVADGILVDEHAPSGETGGGAAGNASHVDLDRTGVTNTSDLIAGGAAEGAKRIGIEIGISGHGTCGSSACAASAKDGAGWGAERGAGYIQHVFFRPGGCCLPGVEGLVARSVFGVEQGLDSVFRVRRDWLSRSAKPGVTGSKQLRDHILTRDAQPGVRRIE